MQHNPHDLAHVAGGSSGGSGAAVAAGLVPIALASDTNGSIRVPASFCGTFGLKPTYGRLSRAGTRPFVASLDHLGPLTRTVGDLAMSYDAMQGADPDDPACAGRPIEPASPILEHGASAVIVSHDRSFVRNIGTRFLEIRGARAVEVADPEGFFLSAATET